MNLLLVVQVAKAGLRWADERQHKGTPEHKLAVEAFIAGWWAAMDDLDSPRDDDDQETEDK